MTLSTTELSALTEKSDSYLRRLARKGETVRHDDIIYRATLVGNRWVWKGRRVKQ